MPSQSVINPSTPVSALFMIGQTYAKRLHGLGIETVEDLINHYPFRYDDFSLISKIALLQPGEIATIQGTVISMKNLYTKNGKKIQKALVTDQTGQIEIIWFNQQFLTQTIKEEATISLSGKVDFFDHKLAMISPEYEITKNPQPVNIHTGRLVPVYPETYGLSSKWLRSRIAPLLPLIIPQIADYLPESIRQKNNLLPLAAALQKIHFPDSKNDMEKARERLSFDELFFIQITSLQRKKEWAKEKVGNRFKITDFQNNIQKFGSNLPFELTNAQKRVIKEIFADLVKEKPMNRLLQGDVGSGKTVVASLCLYLSYLNGCESALMAPTEILANQHYQTIKTLLEPLGLKIGLFTGSTNKKPASRNPQPATDYNIYIGTHALLSEKLQFPKLGLIVIDEQHRFGVEQRAKLKNKGINPHLLTMTATPIPRTIALTLFAELDLSLIDEMPLGRKTVKTWVVPEEKRDRAYQWINNKIVTEKTQAFIVCPLIEESETLQSVKAVKKEFEILQNTVFPKLKLGLLHGRLKGKEKEDVLKKFRDGLLDILVATPVVEVGIDIPNATIIVIEGAERFGLAQLHQLRGRVGRSDVESYCLLFTQSKSQQAITRLKLMETNHIGIKLAEQDLKLRGPGEIYGTKQHGTVQLKIACLNDLTLIEMAKTSADSLLLDDLSINGYPKIKEKIEKMLKTEVSSD